jgi:hypothetical protein
MSIEWIDMSSSSPSNERDSIASMQEKIMNTMNITHPFGESRPTLCHHSNKAVWLTLVGAIACGGSVGEPTTSSQ